VIFPIRLTGSALLIVADGGRAKGRAFVVAWYVGLVAVGGILLAFADGADTGDDSEPATR
jgi:hypothetical protein